jgi:hypothetical protein
MVIRYKDIKTINSIIKNDYTFKSLFKLEFKYTISYKIFLKKNQFIFLNLFFWIYLSLNKKTNFNTYFLHYNFFLTILNIFSFLKSNNINYRIITKNKNLHVLKNTKIIFLTDDSFKNFKQNGNTIVYCLNKLNYKLLTFLLYLNFISN